MIATIVQMRIYLLNDSDGVDTEDPGLPEQIEDQINVVCADLRKTLLLGEEGIALDIYSMQFRVDAQREVQARWGVVL
jgi:hypothetical protein